ncbi:MAG TPA: sulfotransferase family 2 domain-containing protein [Cytophagaceae bacterium]|jgi:hypothetical protein
MIDYNRKELLVSLHIPKCGGTSFHRVLKSWFRLGFREHYYNHKKQQIPDKSRILPAIGQFIPTIVHGHFDRFHDGINFFEHYPEAKQFISILRNPLELQISFYFYTKKLVKDRSLIWDGKVVESADYLGLSLDEHLETAQYNWLRFMPWDLNFENYKTIFEENFIHIGVTEELQRSVDIMAEKLKMPAKKVPRENEAERNEKPSESSIKIFEANHKLELEIYQYVAMLNI